MPEDNEKVEDFISLWRKKMETEIKKPSVIGDTLERIKAVEKENEELRNKIKENIDLISRTEKFIKETLNENERLRQAQMSGGIGVNNVKQENLKLYDRIKTLETMILEKDAELNEREREIAELRIESYSTPRPTEPKPEIGTDIDSTVTNALIEDLKSELSKKKSLISEYEETIKTKDTEINELMEENKSLNEQLIEKLKKLPIDYVVPVEETKKSEVTSQPNQSSSTTLELLCQDLQSDLNRAKSIIKTLTDEKLELKYALESGGFQLEPEEIKELKRENEDLRQEVSKLQDSLKLKTKVPQPPIFTKDIEYEIKDLQEQLKEKDNLIAKLKASRPAQKIVPTGPMADLIEDLQNNINKLKLTIEEKNKIIEELKSS